MCQGCQNKVVKNVAYRVDHVGSFLRPKELVEAREKFSKGELSQEELTKVEDKVIAELVEKQIENGLKGVTDGEFRRAYWPLDFFWGLNGVEHVQGEKVTHSKVLKLNQIQQKYQEKSAEKITHS